MPNKEWLSSLEPGDPVIVNHGFAYASKKVDRVVRLTKTQVVLKKSSFKYKRRDGNAIGGGSYAGGYISEADPAKIKQVEDDNKTKTMKGEIYKFIESRKFRVLPLEDTENIHRAVVNAMSEE